MLRPTQLSILTAPLVPVALAATAGIVVDRLWILPLAGSLALALVGVLAWLILVNTSKKLLALFYLWMSIAGLGSAYHHWRRHHLDAGDLSHLAKEERQPARFRGTLHSAPLVQLAKPDPLRTLPSDDTTRFVLRVAERQHLASGDWHDVGGLVQVTVLGQVQDITVGDEVELLGRLALPGGPVNPGGLDFDAVLRDQGITTTLVVLKPTDVTLLRPGWPTSPFGLLAIVRGWGQETLARELNAQHDVAAALLLGEGSAMTGEAWEQYRRSGVLHVLAISGQHLVVLAGFLWILARIFGLRRWQAAPLIALLLIGYALLTGGRPPVMRAAWVVAAFSGGVLLQRPASPANTFALAWLGVIAINPTDIINAGCQLSFLAVAVLVGPVARWVDEPQDPLERVVDQARPWYVMMFVWVWRWLVACYAINAVVWLAVAPLVAAHYNTVSPIALLIGPPVTLLTSIALLTGFAFLLFVGWCYPLAWVFGWLTQGSLMGCEFVVSLGQQAPGAYFYVADVPTWWLGIFYAALLAGIAWQMSWRWGRWALAVGGAWLALGMAMQMWPHRTGEFRCTFVAVGHGGCTVIETPGGRVIVYDAGATTGADVTRRHIAPFLWSRGIRRIDTLILSHGDLDHFNGVPQLSERFTIDRVISTPTFAQRELAGMRKALSALDSRGLSVEVVHAGISWEEDGVFFEVLHPPLVGPTKNENARSLVLLVKHRGWSMLLTGDLEDAGLTQVLAKSAPAIDVLMAPHHGSDKSNIVELAKWAKPKVVVSSQAAPISDRVSVAMYEKRGAKFLGTWPHGAITLRPTASESQVETYRTKLKLSPF